MKLVREVQFLRGGMPGGEKQQDCEQGPAKDRRPLRTAGVVTWLATMQRNGSG
jgi:hypothetical protein